MAPRVTAMSPRAAAALRRPLAVVLISTALAGALVGCSKSDKSATSTSGSATSAPSSSGSTASSAGSSTTDATSTTGLPSTTAAPSTSVTSLANASEAQRSAPGDGTGTALLKAVRIGRNPGFERIVFEFVGTTTPGYRVQWVDGPITADGSGAEVQVAGNAYLEMVMQSASGVDLSAPELTVVYTGPDRIATKGQTKLITDLVRTGDFEAVLSWAAGTTKRVPFRVLTLQSPTRIVVDLATA